MQESMQLKDEGSVFWGAFWMLILSLLLFWLPGIGSLIAGIVGGKIAGSVGRAFLASILPSLVLGVALLVLAQLLIGIPWLAALIALGTVMFAIIGAGTLVIGALIGGLLA
ncbi:MAG: hypothetical protein JWQ90_1958 [Hydrocarboniphaga sp.]|uniref:hypothetical protein n=1 Tax=Hydrocarboniphaga sp. TaxID=2033016 RepID=UPI00260749D5|nr:hypothetical protein [Hydrocarboniphaga sp.]MDB5969508.1 hypothetical protein [Hydrocarboniphaga sp.]